MLKVSINMLCWNNLDVLKKSLIVIVDECHKLRRHDISSEIIIVDNNSTDGTDVFIVGVLPLSIPIEFVSNPIDTGQSAMRNQAIDMSDRNSKYLILIDGDIIPMKNSFKLMIDFMEQHPEVGNLGAENSLGISDMSKVTHELDSLEVSRVSSRNAFTWYGIFRAEIFFSKRLRFEESEPFRGPGYGLEDTDMYFQIEKLGYKVMKFGKFRYYHKKHTGLSQLRNKGIDVDWIYTERAKILKKKWGIRIPCKPPF